MMRAGNRMKLWKNVAATGVPEKIPVHETSAARKRLNRSSVTNAWGGVMIAP